MIKSFYKNIPILFLLEVIIKIKFILIIPFVTRIYGAAEYGKITQANALTSLFLPFLLIGTEDAFIRFYSSKSTAEKYLALNYWFKFITTTYLVAVVFFLFFSNSISKYFFQNEITWCLVVLILLLSQLFFSMVRTWHRINNDAKKITILYFASTLNCFFMIIIALITKITASYFILFNSLGDFAIGLFFYLLILRKRGEVTRIHDEKGRGITKKLISYGIVVMPGSLAVWALNIADRLILTKYVSLSDIGIYSFSYSIGQAALYLIFGPIWMLYPNNASKYIDEKNYSELRSITQSSITLAMTFIIPTIIFLYASRGEITLLLSTASFLKGGMIFPFVSAGYCFCMLSSYHEVILCNFNQQKQATIHILISAFINITLNFIFIPYIGILGAALATTTAFGILYMLNYYASRKYLLFAYDTKYLFKTIIASIILLPILNHITIPNKYFYFLICGPLFYTAYFAIIYWMAPEKRIFYTFASNKLFSYFRRYGPQKSSSLL
ncbi:MAG: polysaccharide biosynthesis protein [Oligoflexia bacterium]|nr:polysaccharide biosynthesis protein [Oligoflexia bacterium]